MPPNLSQLRSMFTTMLANTPTAAKTVGKNVAERAAYGAAGYGVGSLAEREMNSRGADLSPGSAAAMKMNPALMYAALGPSAVKWGKQPFTSPQAFGPLARVWRPVTVGTAATINPVISYLTDPGKKRVRSGLEGMREISGTVPNYLKSVSDDISALTNAGKYKEDPNITATMSAGDAARLKRTGKAPAPQEVKARGSNASALGETIKRIMSPVISEAAKDIKEQTVPALDPAIRSVGKQLTGGALGTMGAYGLANWLLPQVKDESPERRMLMTPEERDAAYYKRQRKETNRKALAALIGALGGTAGSLIADPATAKYWWQAATGRGK